MTYDLAVIGGGSAGFGAALAAARRGLRVLLADPGHMLGGTSTLGGVNTWEPGIGGPGFHAELYARLRQRPMAIGVSRSIHLWTAAEPWGWSRVDRDLDYPLSLRRSGLDADAWTRVTFEPDCMAAEMALMLSETGLVDLRLGTRLVAAETTGDCVTAIRLDTAGCQWSAAAGFFVDATGQAALAQAANCAVYTGCEPRSMYDEPHAPEHHEDRLNGVSLCYRVTPVATRAVAPRPEHVTAGTWRPAAHSITEYPCGDLNMNPLPLMEGIEHHRIPTQLRREQLLQRVYLAWHWLQTEKGFDRYRLAQVFPMTGIREGPRLVGRQVLTENDIRGGCRSQAHPERWITLADHALDVHGEGHFCRELEQPYGIPYDCLLPREFSNLAVACRGSSFSHIAAASCRLSRTMMQLGHAAGLAVALAHRQSRRLPDLDTRELQNWLATDHVSLDPDDPCFR